MAEEGQEDDARVCGIEKHDVMCWLVEVMCGRLKVILELRVFFEKEFEREVEWLALQRARRRRRRRRVAGPESFPGAGSSIEGPDDEWILF